MARKSTAFKKPKTYEEQHIGTEPEIGSILTTTHEVIDALNYYNYFYDRKQSIEFLTKYLHRIESDDLVKLKKIDDIRIPITTGYIARMFDRQVVLPDETSNWFSKSLRQTIEKYYKEEPKKPRQRAAAVTISETQYITQLEEEVDNFVKNKYVSEFKFTEWAKANNVGPTTIAAVANFYRPLLDELENVSKDKDLKEAYKSLSAKQRNSYRDFIKSFVTDAEAILENRRRVRTPRKKRQPKIENVIKGLHYLAEDTTLNVSSISPAKIIGASQLIIFNVNTRKVSIFHATAGQTLTLKGSTLVNYDEKKSVERRIRKPHEVIPKLISSGKREINKIMNGLSTTETIVTSGRINKHCLLLVTF